MNYMLEKRKKLFEQIDLYTVTCEELSNGRSNYEVLDAVIKGGGKIIQLRDKKCCRERFLEMAKKFRKITADAEILLIINDYIDVAIEVDADGVHLGQEDFSIAKARKIAPDLIIGSSSHNLEEALDAQSAGADYVNIGPVFPTGTKLHLKVVGVEMIEEIVPHLHIPFTVMGGIKTTNIDKVLQTGAKKIAVVTAVTMADDMTSAVKELRAAIGNQF
ncbi:MAG: thiamine phosphate synthase [Chlamydiae bacterium]|nr:MAG: thiamine phosphate synthase [Chlamydiota bacterium]